MPAQGLEPVGYDAAPDAGDSAADHASRLEEARLNGAQAKTLSDVRHHDQKALGVEVDGHVSRHHRPQRPAVAATGGLCRL